MLARVLLKDKPIVVLLDPPRAGCDRMTLSRIADLQPRRIVYVSCHPPTQARDLRFLAACGYRLGEALPIDMFPQTGHIEVVSLLSRL